MWVQLQGLKCEKEKDGDRERQREREKERERPTKAEIGRCRENFSRWLIAFPIALNEPYVLVGM
jgi:hypothetical protein